MGESGTGVACDGAMIYVAGRAHQNIDNASATSKTSPTTTNHENSKEINATDRSNHEILILT